MKEKIFKKQKISAFLATFLLVIGVTATCVFATGEYAETKSGKFSVIRSSNSIGVAHGSVLHGLVEVDSSSASRVYAALQEKNGGWRKIADFGAKTSEKAERIFNCGESGFLKGVSDKYQYRQCRICLKAKDGLSANAYGFIYR